MGCRNPEAGRVETTSYTVKASDVKAGKVVNVATASGKSADPRDNNKSVPVKDGTTEDKTSSDKVTPATAKTGTGNTPKTGDSTPLAMWFAIMMAAALIAAAALQRKRRSSR